MIGPRMRGVALAGTVALALGGGYGGAKAVSSSPEAGSARLPQAVVAGNPARGKKLFLRTGCGGCHTFAAARTKGTIGPNLDKSLKGKTRAYIRESIVKPNARIARGYPPNVMPLDYGKRLVKRQIDDLVAFLFGQRRR